MNNLERFIARIPTLDPTTCWPFPGAENSVTGYRGAYYKGKRTTGHRAVFLATGHVIPAGLHLDHLCRNRACCNPAHLEPVTNGDNVRRGVAARLCHCTACVANRASHTPANRLAAALAHGRAIEHGVGGYANYGCRCDVCRDAISAYHRERRAARVSA